ncbi:MAG: hypothetical protein EKK48_08140 [Candidatus Melainabacteria bacterium]|nr:MAG: hypothetical protein EKK48_08140 [Candidatus Melainabacteria bacterium]
MPDQTEPSAPRFRSQPNLSRYPVGDNAQLVYCPVTNDTQLVSNLHMQLVERCQAFATLDQHAVRLCNELGFGPLHVAATKAILNQLGETGLLLSDQEMRRRLAHASVSNDDSEPAPVPLISSVGIPTRDRPNELERCIRSYAQCCKSFDRKMKFVVADQSTEEKMRQTNLAILRRLKAEFNLDIEYAGVKEKRRFADILSKHCDIEPTAVSFALLNIDNCVVDTGINRNALLWSTQGQLTVQVDDDSICRLMTAPLSQAGLNLDSRFNVYENWFPPVPEILNLTEQCTTDADFFAIHEQLLGQRLHSCIEQFGGGELNFDHASARLLRGGTSRTVLATSIGVTGDSGIGSSHYYLSLDGEERRRLIETEANYRYYMFNHKLIRSVKRATVSDAAFCSGFNLGLDNRKMLPPFLPVQRGQDCVFSNLLHVCLHELTGFLPWALRHNQSNPEKFLQADLQKRILYRNSGEIIERLVNGLAPEPDLSNATKNTVALGRALKEWGTAPFADFEDLLRSIMWEEMSRNLSTLHYSLNKHKGEPTYWANDIASAISWLSKGLTDDNISVAADLCLAFGIEEARTIMQRLVRRFGELLMSWPALIQGVSELNAREVYLPTTVEIH